MGMEEHTCLHSEPAGKGRKKKIKIKIKKIKKKPWY
jgi:hypothetical protein